MINFIYNHLSLAFLFIYFTNDFEKKLGSGGIEW